MRQFFAVDYGLPPFGEAAEADRQQAAHRWPGALGELLGGRPDPVQHSSG